MNGAARRARRCCVNLLVARRRGVKIRVPLSCRTAISISGELDAGTAGCPTGGFSISAGAFGVLGVAPPGNFHVYDYPPFWARTYERRVEAEYRMNVSLPPCRMAGGWRGSIRGSAIGLATCDAGWSFAAPHLTTTKFTRPGKPAHRRRTHQGVGDGPATNMDGD
jgi:hypothetical protein